MNAPRSAIHCLFRLTLAGLVATVSACAPAPGDAEGDGKDVTEAQQPITVFNMNLFENNLVAALEAQSPVGHSYAIYQAGQLARHGGYGFARLSPVRLDSASVVAPLMSMSKTITAAAYMKFLESPDAHLTCNLRDKLDCLISPYLPYSWAKGTGVSTLTFRMLLSHTSGLADPSGSWAGVQQSIQNGADLNIQNQSYDYQNVNYSILRVLMAYIHDKPTAQNQETLGNGPSYTAYYFRDWVRSNLFNPIGISEVDLQPSGATPYMALYSADVSSVYYPPTDGSTILTGGAGSWNMSMKNTALFLDRLRNGVAITPAQWTHMNQIHPATANAAIGFRVFSGAHGSYQSKAGSFSSNGAGGCAQWMMYAENVTAVWHINSVDASGNCPINGNATNMMISAFDSAWE